MKEFIIFVCTDSTEKFFSKLSSAALNYYLPSFFTDSYCAGVSNKHCLLTFFIVKDFPGEFLVLKRAVLLRLFFRDCSFEYPKYVSVEN